ncbi:MAG: RtcB family protein [Chitinophagales bacterium]|nr:RtcB family protein [Chitinophagaceae bacterium]MCB9065271.1 RtcB family protein [Chitinophagales bacterium]
MKQLILKGKELINIGFPETVAIAKAIEVAQNNFTETDKEDVLQTLKAVLDNPESYTENSLYSPIAAELVVKDDTIPLRESVDYEVYGGEHIEAGAVRQMELAAKLPVSIAGALMPDAHQGYGLPIGGVLATDNAVIPYGVGVDIGCRMCLSIYDIPEQHFKENEDGYKRELIAHTLFGSGAGFGKGLKSDHSILEDDVFSSIPFVKNLHDKAYAQLGSSGSGNHFVEWGIIEMLSDENNLNIPKGKYLALLSHSGSRGLGATTANHYTRLAKEVCKLPAEAQHLAYFDLNSESGQEYWAAMTLAGNYASACHEVIHNKLTKAIGGTLLSRVENHHNFAWKEQLNGKNVIVHRKGATPAGKGVMGIIPGSMTAPGYLVIGRGEEKSINSASHGAGRQMSRTQANNTFTRQSMKEVLTQHDVTLIGGGADEAPGAYKDINAVMASQTELVDVLARFKPKMVRMADDEKRRKKRRK